MYYEWKRIIMKDDNKQRKELTKLKLFHLRLKSCFR